MAKYQYSYYLQVSNLSLKAKGLMAQMLFLDNPNLTINELFKRNKDGKTSILNALKELEDKGFVERIKKRNEKGRFVYEIKLHPVPYQESEE